MSLFRPGPVPRSVAVSRPLWPSLLDSVLTEPDVSGGPELPPQPTLDRPQQAEDLLNEARLEAAEILQRAAAEAESAVDEARREGFAAGHQEGLASGASALEQERDEAHRAVEQARAQAQAIRQAAEADARAMRAEAELQAQAMFNGAKQEAATILAQAQQEQARHLAEAQNSLVDLAVAAAMRLVQGHLALQPESIVAMVKAGLRRLRDTNCSVRVRPEDLPLLEAQRSTLERELSTGLLTLVPDRNLRAGDFVVSSPQGHIDATIQQQSAQLRAGLTAALGGE